MTRPVLSRLMRDIDAARDPAAIRLAIAHALGDPSIEIAFWADAVGRWVDEAGAEVFPPGADDPRCAVTRVAAGERPLAVIVHDRSLLEDEGLVEAVTGAARLALENVRLQAEVRAQLGDVRASRARIVEAEQEERRRIERNLHDGAQQRLVALALSLKMLEQQVASGADHGTAALLEDVSAEAEAAIEELRELARGIHPQVLTEQGLGGALDSLAMRSPVPVRLEVELPERMPESVEAAGYFVCSEALANVAKYSGATEVRVRVVTDGRELRVAVEDDGVGGARLNGGSGLRGLVDRLEAVGGHLEIDSPAGGGTRIEAAIPLREAR